MEIKTALGKTGMAHKKTAGFYASLIGADWSRHLCWHDKKTNKALYPVALDMVFEDDWLPYSPEEEKVRCGACEEAGALDECLLKEDFSVAGIELRIMSASHLRTYHCTCGDKE